MLAVGRKRQEEQEQDGRVSFGTGKGHENMMNEQGEEDGTHWLPPPWGWSTGFCVTKSKYDVRLKVDDCCKGQSNAGKNASGGITKKKRRYVSKVVRKLDMSDQSEKEHD